MSTTVCASYCTVCAPELQSPGVLGAYLSALLAGNNNVVIMPICPAHNTNHDVYMAAVTPVDGIALHNYLQMIEGECFEALGPLHDTLKYWFSCFSGHLKGAFLFIAIRYVV
ncbi:hypothetical protein [Pseudomonas sp. 1152_12]|uniref:hypothetical protein n=1 Tax=Pseudomonas sp. 1152_12 TaxID=2604455 RepID=UPI0040637B2D